eukprot:CAMPEP_0118892612 /NCGR_PEP_ID=MMETSP1166-20130328/2146_1 /TAXON_ID=1104430 /ORGANISM="Chrysoreinhardia sp, Strain CCMP3193" /LENGTH=194 /DNA_ID=CAMNT_0006831355 /DNA_START=875 /DNA_END=1457 /DNA_ORIENTATION=-
MVRGGFRTARGSLKERLGAYFWVQLALHSVLLGVSPFFLAVQRSPAQPANVEGRVSRSSAVSEARWPSTTPVITRRRPGRHFVAATRQGSPCARRWSPQKTGHAKTMSSSVAEMIFGLEQGAGSDPRHCRRSIRGRLEKLFGAPLVTAPAAAKTKAEKVCVREHRLFSRRSTKDVERTKRRAAPQRTHPEAGTT